MLRFLISLYIIFMPWATWLALSSWLRLPVVLCLAVTVTAAPFLWRLFIRKPLFFFQEQEDRLLLVFLILVWVAFFMGFFNARSFNHSLSYTFSIIVYFILFKGILRYLGISTLKIGKLVAIAVILANSITIIEWTLLNVFSTYIRGYFLTGGEATSNMRFYWQPFFLAVAGVGEEPGNTASLVNMLFPIGLLYLRAKEKPYKYQLLYVLIHVLSLIFFASVAGIVFFAIALIAALVLNVNWLIRLSKAFAVLILLLGIFYSLDLFHSRQLTAKYWEYMEEKISLSSGNPSSLDRKNKWTLALEDWWESPIFGQGPGHGTEKHSTGYFNTFLTILADTGIFTFILFLSFFFILFLKVLRLPPEERFFYFFSLSVLILHSSVYYVYYHGAFWLPIILIQISYARTIGQNQSATGGTPILKQNNGQ